MRLHLVLGVTLLMHSLEVKGGPTADIEGEEKTCKAFGEECKDVSECCEDIKGLVCMNKKQNTFAHANVLLQIADFVGANLWKKAR